MARDAIKAGRNAEEVLWAVWDASGLAPIWQAASAAGGAAGAAADRDLDAVLALFDTAARFTDTLPPGAPGLFLDRLTGARSPATRWPSRPPGTRPSGS